MNVAFKDHHFLACPFSNSLTVVSCKGDWHFSVCQGNFKCKKSWVTGAIPLVRSASACLMESMETFTWPTLAPQPFHHYYSDWWFGTFFFPLFFHILGIIISSSQVTFIFFRGGWNHQQVLHSHFPCLFPYSLTPRKHQKTRCLAVSFFILGTWDDSPCHPHVQTSPSQLWYAQVWVRTTGSTSSPEHLESGLLSFHHRKDDGYSFLSHGRPRLDCVGCFEGFSWGYFWCHGGFILFWSSGLSKLSWIRQTRFIMIHHSLYFSLSYAYHVISHFHFWSHFDKQYLNH